MVPEQRDRTSVLDHGYVQLVETWGSDERIVEAARMSTDKGFQGWGKSPEYVCNDCGYTYGFTEAPSSIACPNRGNSCNGMLEYIAYPPGDEKLLAYLYTHRHMTPFEMAGMTIEVQAPIFVFREWHRHRTQSYNELSARYTPLPDINYVPTIERLLMTSDKNKQAQSTGAKIDEAGAKDFQGALIEHYEAADRLYRLSLGAAGVPKELARLIIPVGRYSRMRASANLRNWLAFLTLRMDQSAQWEIRQYANAVGDLIAERFPRTWQLFTKEVK